MTSYFPKCHSPKQALHSAVYSYAYATRVYSGHMNLNVDAPVTGTNTTNTNQTDRPASLICAHHSCHAAARVNKNTTESAELLGIASCSREQLVPHSRDFKQLRVWIHQGTKKLTNSFSVCVWEREKGSVEATNHSTGHKTVSHMLPLFVLLCSEDYDYESTWSRSGSGGQFQHSSTQDYKDQIHVFAASSVNLNRTNLSDDAFCEFSCTEKINLQPLKPHRWTQRGPDHCVHHVMSLMNSVRNIWSS